MISIVTKEIKLNCLYKYILLSENLKEENINIRIFMPMHSYGEILKFKSFLKEKKEYSRYLEKINDLDFAICEDGNHKFDHKKMMNSQMVKKGIFDSDYILYVSDKRSKINLPSVKEIIDKTIIIKMRSCNDIYYPSFLKAGKLMAIWIPSETYTNHCSIKNQCSDFFIPEKIKKEDVSINPICNVDFISPLETCDISNPYIDIDEDYIVNKYSLDKNKKTIWYYFTTNDENDELIAKKFISDEKLKEKYNLLLVDKPYQFYPSSSTRSNFPEKGIRIAQYSNLIVDHVDYEWIMRNMLYSVIGGISTAIRETLICNVPVLSILKKNSMQYQGNTMTFSQFFKQIFDKNIENSDQFEGLEIELNDDWIPCLDKIRDQKYNFEIKRKMWFGDFSLEKRIKKLYSGPKIKL